MMIEKEVTVGVNIGKGSNGCQILAGSLLAGAVLPASLDG